MKLSLFNRFLVHKSIVHLRKLVRHVRPEGQSRCYCSCSKTISKYETSQPGLLESRFYGVNQFGRISISVPFNLKVESLDPQKYPDNGKLLIRLTYCPEDSDLSNSQNMASDSALAALTKLYNFDCDIDDLDDIKLNARFNTVTTFPVTCLVQMPMNFDLNVECSGKLTTVQNLENNEIKILTTNSMCALTKIKGENITVQSTEGDIVCSKVVQGNLNMSVKGKGNISTERIQGQTIQCSVEEGDITCSSVYGITSQFTCDHGNINLKNNHGSSKTCVNQGNLTIDSLDGSLDAKVKNGSTDLFITRPEDVSVEAENGDITIKLLETETSLELEGNNVLIDDKLTLVDEKRETTGERQKLQGCLQGTGGQIKATTKNGNITVKPLDWMESLKLKGFSTE